MKSRYCSLTNVSKRVYNTGLANIKKYYQEKNKILSYFDNCKLLKNIELVSFLNAEMFQRTQNRVSASIESYFKLNNLRLNPNFPDYLNLLHVKKYLDYFLTLIILRI